MNPNVATLSSFRTERAAVMRAAQPATSQVVQLTPDSLMMYCASELRRLDQQITSRMNGQQATRDAQAILSECREWLVKYDTPGGIGADDKHLVPHILTRLKDAYDALPEGNPQRAEIQKHFDNFRNTTCLKNGHGTLSLQDDAAVVKAQIQKDVDGKTNCSENRANQDEVKTMLHSLNAITEELTHGAELEMINLQSLISQRQMAIQLTTNLLEKLNESLLLPIANLK